MIRMHVLQLTIFVVSLLLSSCVRVDPVVLDRHAQLEHQILGRLQRLEADLILSSSVRGEAQLDAQTRDGVHSVFAREAIDAARRRAFNLDDIERFKASGQLGEGRDGRLQILALPRQPRQARWLHELVEQENSDREVLMRRVIQLSPELKHDGMVLVRRAFCRLVMQTAKPGQRVQLADGRWIVVGETVRTGRGPDR